MNELASWRRRAILLLVTACLSVSSTSPVQAVTIPSVPIKAVDAESGEPLEWLRVYYRCDRESLSPFEGWTHVYISEYFFLATKEGETRLPERSFLVLNWLGYEPWHIQLESPGHLPSHLSSEDIKKWGESGERFLTVRFARDKVATVHLPSYDLSKGQEVPSDVYMIKQYEFVLEHWESYCFSQYDLDGPLHELRAYLDLLQRLNVDEHFNVSQAWKTYRNLRFLERARTIYRQLVSDYPSILEKREFFERYSFLRDSDSSCQPPGPVAAPG